MQASESPAPTEQRDFLLEACLFQKEAADICRNQLPVQPELADYLSSLWLAELSYLIPGTTSSKLRRSNCIYCGALRDPNNFVVRLKPRRRKLRHAGSTVVREGIVDAVAAAKNKLVYRCLRCGKSVTMSGISRQQQQILQRQSSTADRKKAKVLVRSTGIVKPKSAAAYIPSVPEPNVRKKKKRDTNAGLRIPPKANTASTSSSMLLALKAPKSGPFGKPSNLSKFLI